MGSQVPGNGTGGPVADDALPALQTTQGNALIASHNPLGTLAGAASADQIIVYTVQPGDTPVEIADRFGISLNTLLWANNIRTTSMIHAGDELAILPVTGVQYVVKKGDTLDSIARAFKGDADEIVAFNGLAVGEALAVGATIIIPDGEFAPTPIPSATQRRSRLSSLPEYLGYYMRPIFGGRKSRGIHGYNGIDLANSCGQPVLSSAEGTVIIARPDGWNGGYGRYVVISHQNGTQTLYAHLSSILASLGQHVAQASQIGLIGSTGNSTGCHVHFEIRGARNPF